MDISVNLSGKIAARTFGAVVGIYERKVDDIIGENTLRTFAKLFVPNHEAAQRIADAINAAFESEAV